MGIFKADCQIFDNCLKIHWESLFPTVFRRLLRRIRVGFLPLEKTPGGFRFQVKFQIRFPKPPWTFFYIKTLIVLAFSCLNQVPKRSNNLWCRVKSLTLGVIFVPFVSREPVGQYWESSLIGHTNSLTHGDSNSNRRRHMCLFNLYFLFFIIVLTSSFVMATTVLDLLVSDNICWSQQRHLLWPISPFVQRDWMTIQTQMSGQQIWVIRQRRLPTDQCEYFPESSNVLISTKRQDTVLSPTTFSSHLKSKVMLKAFWSLSSKLIANNKYVKEGHNRFHLLACKAFDSRVTLHSFIEIVSISYICVQWLFCIYSVPCKLL